MKDAINTYNQIIQYVQEQKAQTPRQRFDAQPEALRHALIEAHMVSSTKAKFKKEVLHTTGLTKQGFDKCAACQYAINNWF